MEHHLLDLLALLGAALIFSKVVGGFASRLGIPAVLAELGTGILLGNVGGPFVELSHSPLTHALSEMGVIFLLFMVGLETDIKDLTQVGKDATRAALLGVIIPFALAFICVPLVAVENNFNHTLFMAAALTATSVGITARVLQDMNRLKSLSGQIILGAAVIDDILGIIVLAIVSALVTRGSVNGLELSLLFLKIAGFGLAVVVARRYFLHRAFDRIRPLEVSGTITILLFSLTMIAAWAAERAGLAGIIGAFALGIALDDVHFKGYKEKGEVGLHDLLKPINDFLVPIFFIVVGMGVKLDAMANADSLRLATILIVIGIIGKVATGFGVSRETAAKGADRLLVGCGMIPRGEVGLIFAAMGQRLGVLNTADYGAVVGMVAVTTLIAPGLLAWRVTTRSKEAE